MLKHGMSYTKIYRTYQGMLWRCKTDIPKFSKYYKDKGIDVCDEWRGENGFENFNAWAEKNGYKEGLTLDRVDGNLGYSPENCRWADWTTQDNNKSNNRRVEYSGETHTIAEWSRIVGLKKTTLKERLNRGWSVKDALFAPVLDTKVKKVYQYDKEGNLIKEWDRAVDVAKFYGVHLQSVYNVISGKKRHLKGFVFKH